MSIVSTCYMGNTLISHKCFHMVSDPLTLHIAKVSVCLLKAVQASTSECKLPT